jgi:hypothetical protein
MLEDSLGWWLLIWKMLPQADFVIDMESQKLQMRHINAPTYASRRSKAVH